MGLGVGSYGLDFEAAAPIGNMFAVRAGVGFLPDFSVNTDVNADVVTGGVNKNYDVDIKGKLQRVQGKVIVNFYPIRKSGLFIAAGAYIENADDKFTKIVDKLKVYPVLNFKINTRIL